MKNKIILIAVAAALVAAGGFYGGMKYAENKALSERQQRIRESGGGFAGNQRSGKNGGGFAAGEIISKDDKSVTIKISDARLPDGQGGSKIVFYSGATEIGKFAAASPDDLKIGETVTAVGKINPDGSVSADSIQIRPVKPNPAPR